jgi:RNA polymerase sigma-70 factor (ECF subfamily)
MTERVGGEPSSSTTAANFQNDTSRSASTQVLLEVFESDYPFLLQRLAGRFGSREAAVEALHDAYIKLRSGPDVGQVRKPRAYLYRMALNLARNRRRNEAMMVPFANSAFFDLPDMAPRQDRIVGAAQEINLAITALHSISLRRQEIFLAKWRDAKSQEEIASEFGIHKRTVQKELAKAEAYVRATLRGYLA